MRREHGPAPSCGSRTEGAPSSSRLGKQLPWDGKPFLVIYPLPELESQRKPFKSRTNTGNVCGVSGLPALRTHNQTKPNSVFPESRQIMLMTLMLRGGRWCEKRGGRGGGQWRIRAQLTAEQLEAGGHWQGAVQGPGASKAEQTAGRLSKGTAAGRESWGTGGEGGRLCPPGTRAAPGELSALQQRSHDPTQLLLGLPSAGGRDGRSAGDRGPSLGPVWLLQRPGRLGPWHLLEAEPAGGSRTTHVVRGRQASRCLRGF